MNLLVGDDFRQLFKTFDHTAFRLEVRDRYNVPEEAEMVRKFLTGEPDEGRKSRPWLDLIREIRSAGKRFERVRVVSLPSTDYSRFGHAGAEINNWAGEEIRYLDRVKAESVGLPNHDYWLFDSRKLARMHFDEDDRLLGTEIIEDPAEIVRHNYWRDVAWHHAIRREDFAIE